MANAPSATALVFAPGVIAIETPLSVADSRSTLSTPTPVRTAIFSFGIDSIAVLSR